MSKIPSYAASARILTPEQVAVLMNTTTLQSIILHKRDITHAIVDMTQIEPAILQEVEHTDPLLRCFRFTKWGAEVAGYLRAKK